MQPLELNAHRNGTTKTIWLLLFRGGGKWSVSQIATAIDRTDQHSVKHMIPNRVSRMVDHGHLMRYRIEGKKTGVLYSVTPECVIPAWVTLSELGIEALP